KYLFIERFGGVVKNFIDWDKEDEIKYVNYDSDSDSENIDNNFYN
ncbi:7008_t:CDS:1, partial [Scutellospora calospora]